VVALGGKGISEMKKHVIIHSKRRVVMVNGKQVPRLLLSIIRGAIGKKFVVKHYKGRKIVITKFPDMSGIVASEKQRVRRDLFGEAVVYAKWIISDAERRKAFRKTLPRKKRGKVYHAAIQLYMWMQGDRQWLRKQLAVKAVVRVQEGNRQWTMGNWQIGNMRGVVKCVRCEGTIGEREWVTGNRQGIVKIRDETVKAGAAMVNDWWYRGAD
jgi:hypothetical protein